MQINRCRCGAAPKIARTEIVPNEPAAYAVHCERLCGDDSHWQMSLTEAVGRWNAGLVRSASGGNGASSDDGKPQH